VIVDHVNVFTQDLRYFCRSARMIEVFKKEIQSNNVDSKTLLIVVWGLGFARWYRWLRLPRSFFFSLFFCQRYLVFEIFLASHFSYHEETRYSFGRFFFENVYLAIE